MHWTVDLDPTIFSIGGLQIRWYGMMYVVATLVGGQILKKLAKEKFFNIPLEKVDSFVTTILISMFLGARFFYVFIYNFSYYIKNPSEMIAVWQGGLSFHGAVFGMAMGAIYFAKKHKIHYLSVFDTLVLAATQGIFFGRLGNFMNSELYGRQSDVPWAMIFKGGGPYPRHPSQLYEAFMEGILLFAILWIVKKKVKTYGYISSVFLMGYGLFRFIVEFFREPDSQLGYLFLGLTMGQLLCFIMIIFGLLGVLLVKRLQVKEDLSLPR